MLTPCRPSRLANLLFALALLLCSACSTTVNVHGSIPTPLCHRLPVIANLVVDKDFAAYTHNDKKDKKITFSIGAAQTAMLRTVAAALFDKVNESSTRAPHPGQLTLHPGVQEIQLSTPFDNQLKVFEVWIRYSIKTLDGNGDLISDWNMTAYGKTPTRFLGSDDEALNQAAMVALRDAGARLSLEYPQLPEIQQWLRAQNSVTVR